MYKIMLWAGMVVSLAGCAPVVKTHYEQPHESLPLVWEKSGGKGEEAISEQWWKVFGDETLNILIERAIMRNADLETAAINMKRARLEADLTDTNLTPDFAQSFSATSTKNLSSGRPSQRNYSGNTMLSYEVDLWGKLSGARDAAAWSAQASQYDWQSARLSLINLTVSAYWTIAGINEQLIYQQEDINASLRTEALVNSRVNVGADSQSALAQARRTTTDRRVGYEQLLQQRESQRKVLVMLLNEELPTAAVTRYTLPQKNLPEVSPGLPAEILQRRPDVAAAEARIRSSLAKFNMTKASFYPSLTITGSVATGGVNSGRILSTPIGALGMGLTLPFLQWNTVKINAGISRSDYEASLVAFRRSLYQAFAEVDSSLVLRESILQEGEQLKRSLQQAEKIEQSSAARYRAGKSSLRFWLEDQQGMRAAKAALIGNRQNQLQVQMMLYLALGGGAVLAERS